jgi:cysteate synthase
MKLFRDTEGIDLDPAAAIATAALVGAVEKGAVDAGDHILLNLTGGGYERVREDFTIHPVDPAVTVKPGEPEGDAVNLLKEFLVHHG